MTKKLLLLLLLFGLIGCDIKGSYQPSVLPLEISIDSNGKIYFSAKAAEFVTPIGRFSAGVVANVNAKYGVEKALTIRLNGKDHIYDLNGNDVDISFRSGYYEKINLSSRNGNWILTLRRNEQKSAPSDFNENPSPNNPTPTRVPTPIPSKVFAAIRRGQSCGARSIDYGSTVDFCAWSNFNTLADVSIYSYNTNQTISLGDWHLGSNEHCLTGPMSAPYGKNVFNIKSYDGPSYSVQFIVDDCSGDDICESCRIE